MRLKPLDSEKIWTQMSFAFSQASRMQTCFLPSKFTRKCTSSEMIFTSFSAQISTILVSSSLVKMRPVGLWGLQSIKTAGFSVRILFSKSSQSIS